MDDQRRCYRLRENPAPETARGRNRARRRVRGRRDRWRRTPAPGRKGRRPTLCSCTTIRSGFRSASCRRARWASLGPRCRRRCRNSTPRSAQRCGVISTDNLLRRASSAAAMVSSSLTRRRTSSSRRSRECESALAHRMARVARAALVEIVMRVGRPPGRIPCMLAPGLSRSGGTGRKSTGARPDRPLIERGWNERRSR